MEKYRIEIFIEGPAQIVLDFYALLLSICNSELAEKLGLRISLTGIVNTKEEENAQTEES